MSRGEIYRVKKAGTTDPKKYRLFVIVSRAPVIASKFSTVICAPVYSNFHGFATQVVLTPEDGVVKTCAIHCDELVSLPKSMLTHFVASLGSAKTLELNQALAIALDLEA